MTIKWYKSENTTNYLEFMQVMDQAVNSLINNRYNIHQNETVFLTEHKEVYTYGSNKYNYNQVNINNISLVQTNRGGKVTYHGPGQRMIYPILNLANFNRNKDIKLYIAKLEQWIINSLKYFKLQAFTIPGLIGVWVNQSGSPAKIAAIGVGIRKWVTFHGVAVNIAPNMNYFSDITPCGIVNYQTTSLKNLGIETSFEEFDSIIKLKFEQFF